MAARAIARQVAAIGGELELRFPFDQDLVDELKLAVPARHRHWDKEAKVWRVAGAYAQAAIDILIEHHPTAEVPATYARSKPTVIRRPRREPALPVPYLEHPAAAPCQLTATVTCPKCHHPYQQQIGVTAETSAKAAKHTITPELVSVCPSCNTLAVVAFHPLTAAASV
jgi:hypothetical protein